MVIFSYCNSENMFIELSKVDTMKEAYNKMLSEYSEVLDNMDDFDTIDYYIDDFDETSTEFGAAIIGCDYNHMWKIQQF